jgi:hypothetical protein
MSFLHVAIAPDRTLDLIDADGSRVAGVQSIILEGKVGESVQAFVTLKVPVKISAEKGK